MSIATDAEQLQRHQERRRLARCASAPGAAVRAQPRSGCRRAAWRATYSAYATSRHDAHDDAHRVRHDDGDEHHGEAAEEETEVAAHLASVELEAAPPARAAAPRPAVTAVPTPSSRNAEPSTAPVATDAAEGCPLTSATMGTTVSGREVPSAARRLPVAPLASFMRKPAHSTALVNSSEAVTMSRRPPAKRRAWLTVAAG